MALASLAILAGSGYSAAPSAVVTNTIVRTNPPAITTGPMLQSPTDTSMTVIWITDRETTGVVEYGPTNGELKTAFSSHNGLIDTYERLHKVTLNNLQPGGVYRYRVVSRDILKFVHWKVDYGQTVASEFRTFQVLDRKKDNYSFIVFNDVHGMTTNFPDLLKVVGDKPYDFAILNGDILTYLESEIQLTPMMNQLTASFGRSIPFYWVRGNHETRSRFARQFPAYIASPNGLYYYSFDHGPVHFVVLDAGEDKVDNHKEYAGLADFFHYREMEGEWLKSEVKSKAFRSAKYRVVIVHMPFASAKAANPNTTKEPAAFLGMPHAFDQFGKTLDKAGVHMMISGHMHYPAIIPPEAGRHHYPIVQGGGDKGTNRTVIIVDVSKAGLNATIRRVDGSVFGECRVPEKR